jgi:hypothetical protein
MSVAFFLYISEKLPVRILLARRNCPFGFRHILRCLAQSKDFVCFFLIVHSFQQGI